MTGGKEFCREVIDFNLPTAKQCCSLILIEMNQGRRFSGGEDRLCAHCRCGAGQAVVIAVNAPMVFVCHGAWQEHKV